MPDLNDLETWSAQMRTHWDLDGAFTALDGEYDLNFRVGNGAILKVMREGCDPAFVEMQVSAISHVVNNPRSGNNLDVGYAAPVPDVISANDGRSTATFVDSDGRERIAWMLRAKPGQPYATIKPQSLALIHTVGAELGHLNTLLETFDHPQLDRPIKWNLCDPLWARQHLDLIESRTRREQLSAVLHVFEENCADALGELPRQAIHNDLNDYNILARTNPDGSQELTGMIDFGDMIRAPAICDLAIASAYIILDQPRPIDALAALVAGYHSERPLTDEELDLIWPLTMTRLAVSALNAVDMRQKNPDDPYVMISQEPIDRFFRKLPELNEAYLHAKLRHAVGRAPVQSLPSVSAWLTTEAKEVAPVFKTNVAKAEVLDLSVTGVDAPENPIDLDVTSLNASFAARMADGKPLLGRYAEPRLIYTASGFQAGPHPATNRRTVHMAIDVFLPAGTPVHAPLNGVVHSVAVCPELLGYGGVLTLRHVTDTHEPFFTLYGHLAHDVVDRHTVGDIVSAGDEIALLGSTEENGGWPPHLHLQLGLFDLPGTEWPGVVDPDDWDVWQALCPNPAILLGLPDGPVTAADHDDDVLLQRRRTYSGANLKLSYTKPIPIVRGWKNTLFDDRGRPYLDAYNNVPHVGHSHPRISEAVHRQIRLVNTNTRYLHPAHEAYVEALTRRFPEPLNVCYLLNSASEANELALRLARNFTGAEDTIVSAAGYHGHTCAAIDISHYKFAGPGGEGKKDWVHVVPNPDTYRGSYKRDDPNAGAKFAEPVARAIETLQKHNRKLASFISEPFPSVGGQIIPPPGYLQAVYSHVRDAGGLCIADEVQTGLGRLGRHEWGFAQQQSCPDIVVLGKPIGNGYPLAAVITSREIADAFANGMEFFSTFGGATLACVVGHEVLKILDEEKLSDNAARVGDHLIAQLNEFAEETPAIGDVRGMGLFLGVEMIERGGSHSPEKAAYVVNRLRDQRILIGSDGPHDNVLKIRPPLCFTMDDAIYFLSAIQGVFAEDVIQNF